MDLYNQQIVASRQRKLADLLRAKAEQTPGYEQDQGRMVSGHYVAPSWSQNLSGLVDPILMRRRAAAEEAKASQQDTAYNNATTQARQQWQSSLPQAVAAQAGQAGPVDPNNPTELAPQVAANPLTTGRILQHTLAGMEIPGNEKSAAMYNQGALADLAREDTQAARKEDLSANNAARLVQAQEQRAARLEELRIRNEDRGLDRASREQMARESRALTAQIAQGNQELRRLALEAKKEADADRAATKKAAADEKAKVTTEGEKSSAGYLNRMDQAEKTMADLQGGDQNLIQKAVGGIPMVGKTLQPYTLGVPKQKLLQAQRDWVRAKLRKESGAVIGDEEMAEEIRTYFPQPGEDASIIKQKAESRQAAARQLEIGAGRELSNANMGGRGAAQKVTTQADVDRLAPGTRFVGADGVTYVKE